MALVAIGSAGCQSLIQLHADIFLDNHTSAEKTISITIWDGAGKETKFQQEIALGPETDEIIDNPVERNSDYKVNVRTENGLDETWMWSNVSGELYVSIYDERIAHEAATESGTHTK